MDKNTLLLLGLAVALALVALLFFQSGQTPASLSTGKLEVSDWDASITIALETVHIPTRARGPSVGFVSHIDGRTRLDLVQAQVDTRAAPVRDSFLSHVDAVTRLAPLLTPGLTATAAGIVRVFFSHTFANAALTLTAPEIGTLAVGKKAVFLSHVDARSLIVLVLPSFAE